jgi:hypothetical protein
MKPTYLYIKQHNDTGLKYFGKTVKNPFKYKGSGLYWKKHLNIYGNNVSTIWTMLFNTEEELVEFALKFSTENMIVESSEWANMKYENGLDGGRESGFIGRKLSNQEKNKLSLRMREFNPMYNPEIRKKHSKAMKSDARKQKLSSSKKGNSNTKGKTWYNNGHITKMFLLPPDSTWIKGRLNPTWNNNRKKNAK